MSSRGQRRGPFDRLRRRTGALLVDNGFRLLSTAGRAVPHARPERHGVGRVIDIPYRDSGDPAHRLDIYRPPGPGPHPVAFYVHGGGFRILSKESHWLMGLAFARRGYLTFNVDYRLAPRHPYPAAAEDICLAYQWVTRHAEAWGGDPDRIAIAGESAGANLVTSLAVASSWRRPEVWARGVFGSEHRPRALVAACGMLQVSDPQRFARRRPISRWLQDRLEEVSEAYLGGVDASRPGGLDLADPLLLLESAGPPENPLPPVLGFVGTRDPLLDDTRRLGAAVERLGGVVETEVYPGEVHAFHAFLWRKQARAAWKRTFDFLARHLPGASESDAGVRGG